MIIDLQLKKNTNKTVSIKCLICLNQKKEEQMFRMATCQHRYCHSCVLENIRTKLNSFLQIFCPQCQNNVFDSKVTIYKQLDDKDKNTIQKIRKYNQILKNPQLRLCTDAKCKGFIKFDYNNENGTSDCSECKKKFCNKCYDKEHEGIQCEEEIINKMNKLHYKRCQNCKRFIQRIQGCEHIICTCGNQFCYACGQKWNGDHVCIQNLDQIPLQQDPNFVINTHSIIVSLSHSIVEIQEQYSDIIVSENQPTVNLPPQGQIRKANPRLQIKECKVAQKQQKGSIDKQISSKHDTNNSTQPTNNIKSMNDQKFQREAIDIKTEIRTFQPYYMSEGAVYMNKYLSSNNPSQQTIMNLTNIRAANLQTQKAQQLSLFDKTQQSMNQGRLQDRFIGYNSKQFFDFWTHQNLKIKLILSIIYLILYPFILIIYTLFLIIGYILLQLWLFSPIIYIYEKISLNQDNKQFETTTQDLIIFFLIILFYPLSATFLFFYQISSCYCPNNQPVNAYTSANISKKKKDLNKDFYSPCQKIFYSMFFMVLSPCLILSKSK